MKPAPPRTLASVAARRLELLTQISLQREAMAEAAQDLMKPLAVIDAGIDAVRFVSRHPAILAGAVAALLALRRHGTLRLLKFGWRLLSRDPYAILSGLRNFAAAPSTGANRKA